MNYCACTCSTSTNLSLNPVSSIVKRKCPHKLQQHTKSRFIVRGGGLWSSKRWDLTATSTTESAVAVFGTHSKQWGYLPVMCGCIIYNLLLLLKASVSLHISLAETAGSNRSGVNWCETPTALNTANALAAHVSFRWLLEMPRCQLTSPQPAFSPAALVLSTQSAVLYVRALAPRLRNKSKSTKTTPEISVVCIYKHIILKMYFAHYFPTQATV